MRRLFFIIVLFVVAGIGRAQDISTLSDAVRIENRTAEVQRSAEPQAVQIRLENAGLTNVQVCEISIENAAAVLTPLEIRKDGQPLWLIRSSAAATREKVIAWEFDQTENKLKIYPADWNNAGILEIDLELSLRDSASIETNTNYTIQADVRSGQDYLRAVPSGEGNQISFR
jgi:hypothetical protein